MKWFTAGSFVEAESRLLDGLLDGFTGLALLSAIARKSGRSEDVFQTSAPN
jgi:hypothetical protein